MGLASARQRLKSAWLRHVLTLMSGTVLSQIVPVIVAPLLTRLYSTSDFGHLALFMSITVLAGQVANFRYSIAIMVAEDVDESFALLVLCLLLSVLVALAATVILTVMYAVDIGYQLVPSLLFVPLSILLLSAYESLNVWMNRNRRFGSMARSKVLQSVVAATVSIALGWSWRGGGGGLVCGLVAGQLSCVAALLYVAWSMDRARLSDLSWQAIRSVIPRYRSFPLVTLPAALLNNLTNQLPVILLTAFFSPAVAGLFSLINRVLIAPLSMVATAIRDVFKERAARDYEQHGTCRAIYVRTLYVLTAISIPTISIIALIAPQFFTIVFGDEWTEAGYYGRSLAPMFMVRFAASPLSYVIFIAKKQAYDLFWQIGLLAGVTLALVAGGLMDSARTSVLLYSVCYASAYVVYLVMTYRLSEKPPDT